MRAHSEVGETISRGEESSSQTQGLVAGSGEISEKFVQRSDGL